MSDVPPLMNSEDFKCFFGEMGTEDLLSDVDPIPDEYDTIPVNESLTGQYNFDVSIPPSKSLVYSAKLEKLFIKMSHDFTVLFKWDYQYQKEFYVRAKPRFSNNEDANKPVKRCIQHSHKEDHSNTGMYAPNRYHILRCKNTQAEYQGGLDQHFSVFIKLTHPEAGAEFIPHTYQFVCQNSCSSGMNRRPIEVIFTLEDKDGTIYGRKSVGVRICCCPKRDKEKEEAELVDIPHGQPPPGKKRKCIKRPNSQPLGDEENDISIHSVTVNVLGAHNRKKLLRYAFDILSGDMARQPNNEPLIRPFLEDIHNKIKNS